MKEGETKKEYESEARKLILEYVKTIQYGSVTVNIQDGKIVQIEKNEKVRFKN